MGSFSQTVRRASSITLGVSFVAMATSGAVMFFAHGLATQLRMHPVHNLFGLVMIAAGLVHLAFNLKALGGYLRARWATVLGGVLLAAMALLFAAGLQRPIDGDAVRRVEAILAPVHGHP